MQGTWRTSHLDYILSGHNRTKLLSGFCVIEAAKAGRISLAVSFRAVGRLTDAPAKKLECFLKSPPHVQNFFTTGEGNLLADYLRIWARKGWKRIP
jgi:hypothetical protein